MEYETNIWKLRTERNYSLRDLQELTGISKGRINKIENNKGRAPDLRELTKLAIAMEVRICDLFESEYK